MCFALWNCLNVIPCKAKEFCERTVTLPASANTKHASSSPSKFRRARLCSYLMQVGKAYQSSLFKAVYKPLRHPTVAQQPRAITTAAMRGVKAKTECVRKALHLRIPDGSTANKVSTVLYINGVSR